MPVGTSDVLAQVVDHPVSEEFPHQRTAPVTVSYSRSQLMLLVVLLTGSTGGWPPSGSPMPQIVWLGPALLS